MWVQLAKNRSVTWTMKKHPFGMPDTGACMDLIWKTCEYSINYRMIVFWMETSNGMKPLLEEERWKEKFVFKWREGISYMSFIFRGNSPIKFIVVILGNNWSLTIVVINLPKWILFSMEKVINTQIYQLSHIVGVGPIYHLLNPSRVGSTQIHMRDCVTFFFFFFICK